MTVRPIRRRRGRIFSHVSFALAFAGVFGAGAAFAQASTSVLRVAEDAFGQRIGNEQIGLYSESGVRGFSLQNAELGSDPALGRERRSEPAQELFILKARLSYFYRIADGGVR